MARRVARARFVRPPVRTTMWIGQDIGGVTIVAGSKQLLGSLNAVAFLLRPFTIIRTRLECYFASDQTAASETPNGSMGFIVVSDQAVAAGAASIPGSLTNTDDDWYVHQPMLKDVVSLTSVGVQFDAFIRYQIDSKAMRKIGVNEDTAVMFDSTADGAILQINGRALIKLH